MSRLVNRARVAGAVGLLACPFYTAATQQPETPPAPAPAKDFILPSRREASLPNGMRVTLVSYGTLPLATISLVLRTGAIDEDAGQVWVSKLTGDFLLQGTTTRSAAAIADAVGGMGGSLTVTAGEDETTVGGTVLGDSAGAFVRLLADVSQHPLFPDSEFGRLRTDRLRELSIDQSEPQQLAADRYAALIYPGHSYGRLLPTDSALAHYTAAMVRTFFARNVGAARAHLYVVGRFDPAAVERAVRASFADWAAGSPPTVHTPTPRAERTLAIVDRPGAVQSTLNVGLSVPDPSSPAWIPLDVTNALLGGAFMSRITSNIREQKGYTYSPYSAVDAHYRAADWTESADVTTNVTGASLKEIFGEIDRLRAMPPDTEELRGIQNYLAGLYVLRSSSLQGLVNQLRFVDLHGLGDDYLATYVHRVNGVTPAEVQHTAQQFLDPAKMTIVIAGDQKAIADQVAPYATGSH